MTEPKSGPGPEPERPVHRKWIDWSWIPWAAAKIAHQAHLLAEKDAEIARLTKLLEKAAKQ